MIIRTRSQFGIRGLWVEGWERVGFGGSVFVLALVSGGCVGERSGEREAERQGEKGRGYEPLSKLLVSP